jgi:hypothetical protein
MNSESERIWKEAEVAWFQISRHLPGRTKENHGNLSQTAGLRAKI